MNRLILMITGLFGVSSLLLVDSAIKGAALMLLAMVAALLLRRDSAATRHLMWLLAIIAMLAVPILSAMLPQWRILPQWASIQRPSPEATHSPSIGTFAGTAVGVPHNQTPIEVQSPSPATYQPAAAAQPDSPPATIEPKTPPATIAANWNWINAMPFVWTIGFAALILRLLAARFMLWNFERGSAVIVSATQPARKNDGPLVNALKAACVQLGLARGVTLLVHPDKSIPIVWGILRWRLLLPAAARDWSREQLRSVLLHELAHVKRRDAIAQLLVQFACALHWFNPLVWFAAWRLGVERERACDDLVLASGVRPSAYAGHLLDVVTSLVCARPSQTCGLAMARKSSLEGRLVALLSKSQSRRRVSVMLAAIAMIIGAGIAVPLAMLRAADEKPRTSTPAAAPASAKPAEKLDPALEQKLHWGEPANGLRAALVIRNSPGEANAAGVPDLYMLVQNVSNAPIQLSDTTAAAGNVRYLTFFHDDVPQGRIKIDAPTQAEVTLKPSEAAYLRMCPQGVSRGQHLAAGMLKDAHMILLGQLTIEKAPAGAWTGTLMTGSASAAAAGIDEPAAPKAQGNIDVEKLDPAVEQSLKWGKPVNGLRSAVIFRPQSDQPKPGDTPELYVALQNVSDAAIRITDTDVPANVNLRMLHLKIDGRIVAGLGAREPALGDLTLQPRQVAYLQMFLADKNRADGKTSGQLIAEGTIKDTHESMAIEFTIEKAPAGAWTGKLMTGDATGAVAAGQPQPKSKEGQTLLALWQHHVRGNGSFPGGLVGRLGDKMNEFIRANTGDASGDPYAKKMSPLMPRIDASRDWKPQEVVSLMDDIAAVTPVPLGTLLEEMDQHTLKKGAPLPKNLINAPWGPADASGLRMAWLLEPRGIEHPLGTPLKSRILITNAGNKTVVFCTRYWHQGGHSATDGHGAKIKVESITWMTIGQLMAYRLEPGEFIEVIGTGIGIGTNKNVQESPNARVGSWVEAKAGDDVTITTSPVPLYDWNQAHKEGDNAWWLDFIKASLARDLPLPADAEERKRLVYRVGLEIFGTPLTAEEINSFVSDREPAALDSLAKRFAVRPGLVPFAGDLTSGVTKFRVLPPDPDAKKTPPAVNQPNAPTSPK